MLRLIAAVLLTATAAAQPSAYVGGRWAAFDGDDVRFELRDTTWADGGVFVAARPAGTPRVIDLGDAWVVPPFADAHLHAFYDAGSLASQDSLLVARGVLSALNPMVPATERASVAGSPTTVDVVYAVAGIVAPGSHGATAFEARALGLQAWDVWGERGDEIRASRLREGDAYHLASTVADLDAVWPRVLASGTQIVKVVLNHSETLGTGDAQPSLTPEVLNDVVQRAHADGLRVVAHVETAGDLAAALDAGVDALAHVPGYGTMDADALRDPASPYAMSDALVARLAASGVPVTPTLARGPLTVRYLPASMRPDSAGLADLRAAHGDLLRRLQTAGVALAVGADSGGLWAWDAVDYWVETGGLTPAQALRAWSVTSPRMIFPDRSGGLAPGNEASLLALACDPTADWGCTAQIQHREQRGRAVGEAPRRNPDAAPTAYVGGRWFDGERFAPRDTTWAQDGVFSATRPARIGRTVELGDRFVVHPFGDAHTHQLASRRGLRMADQYRDEGIFFVQVLTNPTRSANAIRDTFATAASLDVAYAHGGITTTESHPHGVYEGLALGAYTRQQQVELADAIRAGRAEEGNAYWFLDTLADVEATWDAYLATRPDVVKIYVMGIADSDSQPTDRRGLRPEVVREVVRRAHAASLPVWAHVETARDVALVTAAGADGLAHLPGYSFARDEARYTLPDSTLRAMAAGGMAVAPTAVLLPRNTRGRPARRTLGQMFQRTTLRRLHAAGVDVVIGADSYGQTATPEASYLHELGVFPPATLLRLWSETTPRAVFPGRALGRLAPGFEANLLALACDPTADWSCTAQIEHREKQGVPLGAPGANEAAQADPEAALTYRIRVEPEAHRLRVDGLWAGGRLADISGWARRALWGASLDTADVATARDTEGGVAFSYTVEVPVAEAENTPVASLSARRLRTWGWDVLRFPLSGDAEPVGPVALQVDAPAGWTAATPFGDAAGQAIVAPSLEAAARSPILAARLRLIEVPAGGAVSRLAVRRGHPVPDSVFALGFTALVETADAYTGGRARPPALFTGIDLGEGKRIFAAGNFSSAPGVASFLVIQDGTQPREAGFWGTIAHEYAHAWLPGPFSVVDGRERHEADGRLWPWFREGWTSYLGWRIAHQAGLLSDVVWLERLQESVRSLGDYGLDSDPTGGRAYVEGAVIALALDASLLAETDARAGFRELLALLLDRHAGDGAAPLTTAALRRAVLDLGGTRTAEHLGALTSEVPAEVLAATEVALRGSPVVLRLGGAPELSLSPDAPGADVFLDPLGQAAERRAREARLVAALDTADYVYPIPSAPVAAPELSAFPAGRESPAGGAWRDLTFGGGSAVEAELRDGALCAEARTGTGYAGAGLELALGTLEETADLSAYDGVELDLAVRAGEVTLQVRAARVDIRDLPSVPLEAGDRRVQHVPWSALGQRGPVESWPESVSRLQVLTQGFGERAASFCLYGVRLYRTDAD